MVGAGRFELETIGPVVSANQRALHDQAVRMSGNRKEAQYLALMRFPVDVVGLAGRGPGGMSDCFGERPHDQLKLMQP